MIESFGVRDLGAATSATTTYLTTDDAVEGVSTPRQPTLSLFPCWSLIREGILLIDNLPYRATADLLAEGTPAGGAGLCPTPWHQGAPWLRDRSVTLTIVNSISSHKEPHELVGW